MSTDAENITLNVEGMDCSSCALSISRRLEKRGLEDVNVNFVTGEASFKLSKDNRLEDVIHDIHKLGYKVAKDEHGHGHSHQTGIEKKFYISLFFTVPLFSHMFLPFHWLHEPLVQLLLCIPVFFIGIQHFGSSAWKSIRAGSPNMDVLITIGSTAAFFYSVAGMIIYKGTAEVNNYLFFETSATIITLVLLGNLLEHRSVQQTTSAIKELGQLQLTRARRLQIINGLEEITEIDSSEISISDVLLLNAGDRIPSDGEVIQGSASIDESMVSGESIPVEKNISDKVIGGTIVLKGNLRMKATRIGKDTMLSQIIELVKSAQKNKPSIQKLGDKVSSIFVPVVLLISLLTFILAYLVFDVSLQKSLMNSIAVLVISCPCAMGLATPTAVMVGIGRAAKSGILIKGGSTLEQLAKIKSIVFDKTGTLTTGNFRVKEMKALHMAESDLINVLFSLEQHSSHPIAKSIVMELKSKAQSLSFSRVNEEKGLGITAADDKGNVFKIGSYAFVKELTSENSHNIYITKNDQLIGWVDIEDEIKSNAKEAITNLKSFNLQTILLSGDSTEKCIQMAEKLGIEKVYGEQLPSQKIQIIEKLVSVSPTAMVGDGINDAPALAKATVGISLSNATQVAIQSAQVVLLNEKDLLKIDEAYRISKHTLLTIKQNLFWAFFYNVVAIPIAAIGLLNPMVGALAMAFSDVIVIGNSLRLKIKKI